MLSALANLYGEKAEVAYEGVTYFSLAIINKEEWQVFKITIFQEKKVMMEKTSAFHFCRT